MVGKLSDSEIDELLQTQLVGRLGCHDAGRTYVVPVSYAYNGEFLYSLTFEGLKLEMMRKNPRVCFQVDSMNDMANWKSAILWGEFEELKDPAIRRSALAILVNRTLPLISSVTTHLSPTWPFIEKDLNRIMGIVYRIRVSEKSGRFESTRKRSDLSS